MSRRAIASAAIVIAVVSVVMPLTVTASTATHLTLAPMHLVVGAVWFASLRRGISLRPGHPPARTHIPA